jgi:hypothetical protein
LVVDDVLPAAAATLILRLRDDTSLVGDGHECVRAAGRADLTCRRRSPIPLDSSAS